jgi:hypothetical protein
MFLNPSNLTLTGAFNYQNASGVNYAAVRATGKPVIDKNLNVSGVLANYMNTRQRVADNFSFTPASNLIIPAKYDPSMNATLDHNPVSLGSVSGMSRGATHENQLAMQVARMESTSVPFDVLQGTIGDSPIAAAGDQFGVAS